MGDTAKPFDSKLAASEITLNTADGEKTVPQDEEAATKMDNILKERSENAYMEIASGIVTASKKQLEEQNKSKNELKQKFTRFFMWFIAGQYVVMIILLIMTGIAPRFSLSETIIVTYITSVFVETLGAIIIMIKYAFDSAQEVNILQILNSVISNYKKFNEK